MQAIFLGNLLVLLNKTSLAEDLQTLLIKSALFFSQEDTISVNHNWLNGCNLDICWLFVQQSYGEVMREIADCRDMDGWSQQCQVVF